MRVLVFVLLWVVGLEACASGPTARRDDFAVEGIDVSHHQARVDWPRVAAEGFEFAYIKATEGADHADTRFRENWTAAREAGLVRGAYHFFRPRTSAAAQAEYFASTVELRPGDLAPVLDVETLDGVARTDLITGMRTWLYLAEIRYGVRPVIYTSLKFYYRHLAGHFDDYTYWIARYGTREPALSAGAEVAIWQYGDRGVVAGIGSGVDLNVLLGGPSALESLRLKPRPPYEFPRRPKPPKVGRPVVTY